MAKSCAESKETPKMEAKAHSPSFLKLASAAAEKVQAARKKKKSK